MPTKNKRLGFVGLVLTHREETAPRINEILSAHAALIVARMGFPRGPNECAVISLVVEATTDELGRLTGRLGQIPGVQVRSALTK